MTDVAPVVKRRKTPASLRKPQILAMQTAGMTQTEIAEQLGVSRRSIVRDLEELQPAREQVEAVLSQLVNKIDSLHSVEESAENYVDLAKHAKNEAVRLATEDRISDFRGIITEKERIRAKAHQAPEPQPMFVLPAGAHVNVTVNQSINKVAPAELEQPIINIDTK